VSKFGGRIIDFLIRHGFAGRIVPINPRRTEIRGRAAFPRLADAPSGVRVAILALPASQLLAAIEDCAAAGVGACVIITTGFAEADAAGSAMQQAILDIARPAGMRIIGPNCMGLINPGWNMALCSSVVLDTDRLNAGRIGLVSQSGALMVSLFDRGAVDGIGFSAAVSLGNQSDVEVCDLIDYFADDPATDAVCAYVEGFAAPHRFAVSAAACRAAGKPLVLVKTGKTADGVRAAKSHTASLAGSYEAFAGICRQQGAVLVEDPVTMIRTADLIRRFPRLRGDGVGIISGSGGAAGLMVDRIAGAGMRLARLSEDTRAGLGALLLPPQADNPIDLGGRLPGAPEDVAVPALRLMAGDPDVGLVVMYLSSMPFFAARTRALAEATLASGTPAVALMLPGAAGTKPRDVLRELGVPSFDSLEDLLVTLRGLFDFHALEAEPPPERPPALPQARRDDDLIGLVEGYGIPVPPHVMAATPAEAAEAAARIGLPVVAKGIVRDATHKTELGLVRLGLHDKAAVAAACADMAADLFLVQAQVPAGLELIASVRRDPQFGPFVMVGAGGTLVELLRDTVSAPAPLSLPGALALLRRLRIAPLLDGWRGAPARDVAAVADALVRLSWLAIDLGEDLADLEINPLIVAEAGKGVSAADIRATWTEGSSA
jgi:acetyl-CoA synthetase (ADP-forming)